MKALRQSSNVTKVSLDAVVEEDEGEEEAEADAEAEEVVEEDEECEVVIFEPSFSFSMAVDEALTSGTQRAKFQNNSSRVVMLRHLRHCNWVCKCPTKASKRQNNRTFFKLLFKDEILQLSPPTATHL